MKILRAEAMGMCFGVRDAIELAQTRAAEGPVTILGDLVHNDTVLADLRARGVLIRQDAADILAAQLRAKLAPRSSRPPARWCTGRTGPSRTWSTRDAIRW